MRSKPIRVIALCLFRRSDQILVEEQEDTVKGDRFCRPIGGGIEYGEHSEAAVVREIQEELGADIEELKLAGIIENIFTCEGQTGHEIVFVYNAKFVDKSLYRQTVLQGYEHGDGNPGHFTAHWRSLEEIKRSGIRLVPDRLTDILRGG